MISRRLVRIKAVQTYYAFLQGNFDNLEQAASAMELSESKSYDLFVEMYCLVVAIADYAQNKIEVNRQKLAPTQEDLNPNMRFVENKIISALRNEPTIEKYMSNVKTNWSEYGEFVKNLYQKFANCEAYKKYMSAEEATLADDRNIVVKLITKFFDDNEELDEILETESIYWNDDLELSLSNMIQSIKKINEDNIEKYRIPKMFNNAEDEKFADILIKKTCLNSQNFDKIIADTIKKWELQRVALLDRVILHLGLCELTQFPEMPVRVTINEYIEIAKAYSTEKSGTFINGILDKIYNEQKENNSLKKIGLGLL